MKTCEGLGPRWGPHTLLWPSGSTGTNRERDIRKAFVEADLIEAVIQLPENLFYNTSAPGIGSAHSNRR
jgi:hypothetical protein